MSDHVRVCGVELFHVQPQLGEERRLQGHSAGGVRFVLVAEGLPGRCAQAWKARAYLHGREIAATVVTHVDAAAAASDLGERLRRLLDALAALPAPPGWARV